MNKGLMSVVSAVAKKFGCECVTRVFTNENSRTIFKGVEGPWGIKLGQCIQLPNLTHKFEYRNILSFLVNHCGLSVKDAAEACGMSYSYATALLRHK